MPKEAQPLRKYSLADIPSHPEYVGSYDNWNQVWVAEGGFSSEDRHKAWVQLGGARSFDDFKSDISRNILGSAPQAMTFLRHNAQGRYAICVYKCTNLRYGACYGAEMMCGKYDIANPNVVLRVGDERTWTVAHECRKIVKLTVDTDRGSATFQF
jgi:hypothetical protein